MPRTILLRSSWQTVNIGDIAHTPGILHLLERHLPDVDVILWPKSLDRGVEPMLRRRFPRLRIVRDSAPWRIAQPRAGDPTIEQAMAEAALWLHGSGSGINEMRDLNRWRETTGRPYGAFGVTVGSVIGVPNQKELNLPDALRDVLEHAAFVFTRETRSLDGLRRAGIRIPHLDFAPDATFAVDLRDEAAADALLQRTGLEPGRFLCAIPRLRITPYWAMSPGSTLSADEIARRQAVNDAHLEPDHAKLREAIVAWVRETGGVLLCPEMTYQVDLLRPYLFDPLPADVRSKVVPLDRYWRTDEAASVYRRARAVVSMECHSPILANAGGRPGLYLRQPEDTWKGQMYPDLGLGDWKLEMESVRGRDIAETLLRIHNGYDAALDKVKQAARRAADLHARAMGVVKHLLPPA